MKPDKRASTIARNIEADIVGRGWPIGVSLGSEHELQQRFCVSRSVLREAIRLVEHHQVARMRRGPNGGLLVCEPDAGPATRAVVIYLEYLGTTPDDLLNARLVLEPLAAALAAERIDEAGIARLRAALREEQPDLPKALAEQSRNPVLQLFIDVLMRLTTRYALQTHDDHSEIVAAVTAGDPASAKTLSEQHMQAVMQRNRHHGRASRRLNIEAPRGKLAEVLAAGIADDIAAGGWQVGSVFGTEAAMLERYRVSRAVLREAVRLLEYHSVAQMRRGPGGGLVVTKPQAQASIDTIALYLQRRRPSREDLRCVREAIEIDNAARVVKRRTESGVAAFLDTRVPVDGLHDASRAAAEELRFHVGLAQLAGNALLDLFLRIIVELFRRNWSGSGQAPPSRRDVVAVDHAHTRILEAIAAGDDSLARHRLRRHLDAAACWWP